MTFDLLLASIFLNVILGYHYWLKCRENEEMKKYRIKPILTKELNILCLIHQIWLKKLKN